MIKKYKKLKPVKSKHIWILDDDASICEALEIVLKDVGNTVQRFDTGNAVIQKLSDSRPDLIIMDILLTNESGLDISQFIKKRAGFKNLPIILMSANPLTSAELKKSMAQAFLKKPFDIYDLVDLVNLHSSKNANV